MQPSRLIALCCASALLMTACSSRETVTDTPTTPPAVSKATPDQSSSPAPSEAGATEDKDAKGEASSSQGVTIVDQRDITIKLDKPAERLVTAVIPAPAIFAAVDGSYDRIVGQNETTNTFNKLGIAKKMFPQSADMPVISKIDFIPNMEEIIKLKPDLAIQWAHMGDGVIKPLEDAKVPTATLIYGTQKDLEEWIRIFGEAIDKQDRATEMLDTMHKVMEDTKARTKDLPKVRVMQMRGTKDAMVADNKDSYTEDQFAIAGAINVASDLPSMNTTITNEDIIRWDPEVILMSTFMPDTPADIYNDPALANVAAVKNKRVYKTPYGMFHWHIPCAESYLMWQWAAQVFHGDKYGADIEKVTREGMEYLYNYKMDDEDLAVVLQAKANKDSVPYGVTFK